MPDGHSRVEPHLPIPNRIVKRHCADDSAETGVKVGYCQATLSIKPLSTDRGFSVSIPTFLSPLFFLPFPVFLFFNDTPCGNIHLHFGGQNNYRGFFRQMVHFFCKIASDVDV